VARAGVEEVATETIQIGERSTTARGSRYLTPQAFDALRASGEIRVIEQIDDAGTKFRVESRRWVESDGAIVNRVLGREVGGKQNILVMNDEAHHAYRIRATGAKRRWPHSSKTRMRRKPRRTPGRRRSGSRGSTASTGCAA
jgi:type III restriction enzyme